MTTPQISEPSTASEDEIRALVSSFEQYDFGSDQEFRAGLPAIIKSSKGKGATAADIDATIARAQWFYYTRKKGSDISFETYKQHRSGETESVPMRRPSIAPVIGGLGIGSGASSAPAERQTKKMDDDGISVTSPEISTSALPPDSECPQYELPRSVGDRVAAAEMGGAGSSHVAPERSVNVVETVAPGPEQSIPFDDVVRLISTGRAGEIPTTHVPEGLNTEEGSQSVLPARAKPWEKEGVVPA